MGEQRHQLDVIEAARCCARRGVTVVAILHDLNLAAMLADRILVLNRGTLIAEGSPEQVRRNPEVRSIYLGEGLVYDARHRERSPA